MIPVIENSPSIIYRTTHILQVRIDASRAEEWLAHPSTGVSRKVALELSIVRLFKGQTRQKPGDSLSLEITQYGTGTFRKFAVPGIWSTVQIDPRRELLAFSHGAAGGSPDAATLLVEPACELITSTASAVTDVELALQVENAKPSLPDLFKMIELPSSGVSTYFAEYLWARLQQQALADIKVFDLLVAFLANPNLASVARSALLDLIYSSLYGTAQASDEHRSHFAAGLFSLLDVPQAIDLRDNILGVFLPNLLGIKGGAEGFNPENIFAHLPEGRERAAQKLGAYRGAVDVDALKEWIA